MLVLPVAVLLASLAQDPAPAEVINWRPLNRVEIAVNQSVITLSELRAMLAVAEQRQAITTAEDLAAIKSELAMIRVQELLMVQAGEDLGRPQEEIDAIANDWWNYEINAAGGARQYSESLGAENVDSLKQRQRLINQIHRYSFTQVITGNSPGPQGRPYVDRFIRPGTLRRTYDEFVRTGMRLELFGGTERALVVQELRLASSIGTREDIERLHALGQSLHEQAVSGSDFNELVDAYSDMAGDRAITTDLRPSSLNPLGPEIVFWAQNAEEGDISPLAPVPVLEGGQMRIIGWRIMRIIEVQAEAEIPPFDNLETQLAIRNFLSGRRDNRLTGIAMQELLSVAYVFPDPEQARRAIEEKLRRSQEDPGGPSPQTVPTSGEDEGN